MKVINIIILILTIVFFSCNKNKYDNDSLKNKLEKQQSINDSLIKTLKLEKKKTIGLQEKNEYLSILYGNFSKYFPNKISLFEYMFNHLTKYKRIDDFLASNKGLFHRDASLELNNYNFGFKDYTKKKAFSYIFKTIRRDSDFIKNLFSDKEKKHMFNTIKSSDWYKTSNLDKFIKTLLLSYQDIEQKDINGELYESMSRLDYYIWDVAGEEVQKLLTFTNENGTFCCGETLSYSHFFWVRRKIEGNQKIVYDLLNEFNEFVVKK